MLWCSEAQQEALSTWQPPHTPILLCTAPTAARHFKWLALAAVLLLGVSGIALRSAKRPSIAHRFTKDFYSGIKAEVCLQTVHRLLLTLVSLSICDNSICSTVVA